MTPEEINKLNKESREKREINKKVLKYCYKCQRNREISENEWICPICKSNLQPTSPLQYQNTQIKADQLNIPKCPTCGSTNIKKISDLRRGIHGLAWGILSNTARSQFECKKCGYKF